MLRLMKFTEHLLDRFLRSIAKVGVGHVGRMYKGRGWCVVGTWEGHGGRKAWDVEGTCKGMCAWGGDDLL